jgi:Deoxyribonuclease NucA/NucB
MLNKPLALCLLGIVGLSIAGLSSYANANANAKHNSKSGQVPIVNKLAASPAPLPIVTFSRATVPNIAANIEKAQKNGQPSILTRNTSKEDAKSNRYEACKKTVNGTKVFVATPAEIAAGRTSCDEYPFASTLEGGLGATVAAVKPTENSSQGGTLGSFYTSKGIKDGDRFKVEVSP